jgi:LmbE family N-acetylglucosaminyl deacetylase
MAINDIRELGTILSVWAHPDDEAYLCGGIMAMASAAGSRVVCVTATRGELGVTDAARWPPDRLPAIREAEMAECLRVLGVSEHHWLGYPDGGCAEVDRHEGADRVARILRAVQPDTVLTFAADGQTGHPDHMAVHRWSADAITATAIGTLHVVANTQAWMDEFLPQMLQMNVLMGDPPVTWTAPLSIDLLLSDEVLARKLTALAAQASQTELLRAAVGDDFYRRLIGSERFGRYPA